MNLPKKIRIMAYDYEIRNMTQQEQRDGKYLGTCLNSEAQITINGSWKPQVQATTFLHEIIHAIAHQMGKFNLSDEQEEKVVEGLSTGICVLMRDNPKLLPLIQKALK